MKLETCHVQVVDDLCTTILSRAELEDIRNKSSGIVPCTFYFPFSSIQSLKPTSVKK